RDPVTPADVYGYYPFNNGMSDVDAYSFEVRADQSVRTEGEMCAYEASDFLWAKTPKATPGKKVNLTFGHIMAGVKVVLEKGSGFTEDSWDKLSKLVTVDNTVRTAEIDLSKGSAVPYGSFDRNVVMCPESADTYRAVVVPQTVEAGKPIISITMDGVAYNLNRDGGMTYTPGKLHTFTIKVDKKETGDYALTLTAQEITAWVNDQLSHNFFEYEYTTVEVREAGTLKSSLLALGKDYERVKNLKVIGPLNCLDFVFMRDEMSELAMLNMKDVLCREDNIEGVELPWNIEPCRNEKAIPRNALAGKSTLRRIILPDEIEYIGANSFSGTGLDVNSSLLLPPHTRYIESGAFSYIGEAGELILNDNLEHIDGYAFAGSSFQWEINLPSSLKYIGDMAFAGVRCNSEASGSARNFRLPDHMEYIGEDAFAGIVLDGVGELIVPNFVTELKSIFPRFKSGATIKFHDNIKKIGERALSDHKFINRVDIPDKVTHIERAAFVYSVFSAGLTLPSSLRELGTSCFMGARGLGDLVIPDGVEFIPGGCFGDYAELNSIVLPNSILYIDGEAFSSSSVKSVTIGKNCNYIGECAFAGARQLQTLICLNPEPPVLDADNPDDGHYPFRDCEFDHLVLQVPEKSVELYRNTPGWNHIRFITAYHEMSVGVSEIQCLDKGIEYNTLLRSEGDWEVSSCPDWVNVTPSSGDLRRNEITIKVASTSVGNEREGTVVFKLKGKDYTTTVNIRQLGHDKEEDKEYSLQKASAGGKEIPVLFIGEGFTASDIVDGSYDKMVEEAYDNFFSIEPYKSYKEYFSASAAVAVSPDKGISRNSMETTKFNFHYVDGMLSIDWDEVRSYAVSIDPKFNSPEALVVLVPNYDSFVGMVSHSDSEADVALCGYSQDSYPYDFRGVVQHYAGGVAFGKLAPEYVSHYEFIRGCSCPGCNGLEEYRKGVAKGWYGNVSMSGSVNTVPWGHYIFDPRYSDIVDVFEGGYRHLRGVYRSENQSCMSTYINYFNTISRELIVRRIMSLSGKTFSFDGFVAKDSREGWPQ
ncbi:MAG: leucine-rich repeat protein, partial [Muribaculaceae bacterium]|nr:leucine-rich repeat protein [Muribaculaceae bacterium]